MRRFSDSHLLPRLKYVFPGTATGMVMDDAASCLMPDNQQQRPTPVIPHDTRLKYHYLWIL
jgi:hypothetical protein